MSTVIALSLQSETQAKEALRRLGAMQKEHLLEILDAAIVTRDVEKNKVSVDQSHDLVTEGAFSGGFWGLLLGLLFANPVLGLATGAIGAGVGALIGRSSDIGINDEFMKEIGSQLTPGSAILFLMVRDVTADKVLERLQDLPMRLVASSLTHDEEQALREALGDQAETAERTYAHVTG